MKCVMKAFRDPKELGRAINDEPAGIDGDTSNIREQRTEHLSDTTTRGRRIHVPDHPSLQAGAAVFGYLSDLGDNIRASDRQKALDRLRAELYLVCGNQFQSLIISRSQRPRKSRWCCRQMSLCKESTWHDDTLGLPTVKVIRDRGTYAPLCVSV